MATISGIYANAVGEPVTGICITLTARTTSAGVMSGTKATQTTDAAGCYVFSVLPGCYVVEAGESYLGVFNVSDASKDGTLNDFLIAGKND